MKALALISGGLDSVLAAKLIKDQGIEVIGINFDISFGRRRGNIIGTCANAAKELSEGIGIELKIVDIGNEFLKTLQNPKYGFGSNMNPCIDCKILMLRKSKELLKELGASFVVTGEVLAQRPMSQYRPALNLIEKDSGLEGLLLRPLCAKHLEETTPEKEGWVDRNKLMDFNGRSRKPQMELVKKLGIKNAPNASGGCLLTEPLFIKKLQDLIEYKELNLENIELLKIGRHFRLADSAKLIVGRDEKENIYLENVAKGNDYLFLPPDDIAGPSALGRGKFSQELLKTCADIICRYSDLRERTGIKVSIRHGAAISIVEAANLSEEQLAKMRI